MAACSSPSARATVSDGRVEQGLVARTLVKERQGTTITAESAELAEIPGKKALRLCGSGG
jgi:hypothetical protein